MAHDKVRITAREAMDSLQRAMAHERGGEPPAQASQDRPRRDETPADGAGQESATERRTRDHRALAQQWANEARNADPALGTVYALTAIAHAILATKETP